MRIKPYIVLGLATLCAGAGLATVVTTSDPYTAEPAMIKLFWGSLFLLVFAFVSTLFSLLRQRLSVALLGGLVWGGEVVIMALLFQRSVVGSRGLWIVGGTTLLLTFVVFIKAHIKQLTNPQ